MSRTLRDRNGGLWIGTHESGLLHVHQGRTDAFSTSDGLSGEVILGILEDREGNIWVGTNGGLDRFRDSAAVTFNVKQGLSNTVVVTALADKDGSVWLATIGGLNRWDHGQIMIPPTGTAKRDGKLNGNNPTSLFQDDRGRIWVSTFREFGYLEDGRFTTIKGIPKGNKPSIAQDTAGNVWVIDSFVGLFQISPENEVREIPWADLGHKDDASVLAADRREGGLWIGFSQGGIAYFSDGQVRATYTTTDGLGAGRVRDLQFGDDGALWVSTERGLSQLKNKRIATMTSKNGLPCDGVQWTTEEDDRSLWLYMACGLVRIARSELDAWVADPNRTIQATVFDSSDGVRSTLLIGVFHPQVARTPDGRLWFVTGDGVGVIDPRHLPFNKLPPPVHIEQIIADRKTYNASSDANGRLRLPPLIRDLEIDYTALSLAAPAKVRFRVKLEGWDRDWKDAGNERKAFYSNLPPRNYRFRVIACNNSGVWNEAGDTLDFSIVPAYWQTNWFRVSCVAALTILLWMIYKLRVRSIQLHSNQLTLINSKLETQIAENTDLYSDLQRSEAYLAQGQSISHTGSFGLNVLSGEIFWSAETYRIFELDPSAKLTMEAIFQRFHPDDRDRVQQALDHGFHNHLDFDIEHRLLMPTGGIKHIHTLARALKNSSGGLEYVGAVTDVTAARQAEEALRRSESYLAEAQRLTHTGSGAWSVPGWDALYLSEEWYRIYGFDPNQGLSAWKDRLPRMHPDDKAKVQEAKDRATSEKSDYEVDHRIVLPDGTVKYTHTVGHPVLNASGDVEQFVCTMMDVTAAKQAEDKIRQSETEFRQILDFTPQLVAVLGPDRDRTRLYANQTALDYFGVTLEQWQMTSPQKYYHPDDWEVVPSRIQSDFLNGIPYEYEARFLRKDGQYRWFLIRWKPLRDEQARVTRWYVTSTDIEDRKQAEQRLQNENVALREEIDRASMFEEIVGISPALRAVLSCVSKVAPTDSTVLITGETGTGKELIARAVHKRSQRSSKAFVSVNCAAVPRDLIASELFGHEKGAFTGALQRRLGRFELAEGGTIFLDEIGELPAETQIALLRVLQEHEFERVGGTVSIRTNVRVISATNRDLQAAIAGNTFRSDLFYRLNVFPIEMPPLRERREDIPLLVEYFIDRYARKTGKRILGINKNSLELLQSYPWPGNIRELQNVIQRSVIVCETENFSVDESWLSRRSTATGPSVELGLSKKLPSSEEKAIIEAALTECQGKVSGPSGAAAKLGIPGSTLESKIKSLKIDKNRFKSAYISTTGN
jgi:PAS domain S-box-containing protein